MHKVLIVDDDTFARTHLKSLIDWEKHGLMICGEASNGENAIELIEADHPEIIITDISMPVMDGIGLIEYTRRNHPEIQLIALSGYDDFDYVRQSMKMGVVDYLLKHRLNSEELLNILRTVVERIGREQAEKTQKKQLQAQLRLGKATLQREFLKQLIEGGVTDRHEIETNLESLELGLTPYNLAVMIAEIDDFKILEEKYTVKELDRFIQAFLDLAGEVMRDFNNSAVFYLASGRFVVLFSFGQTYSGLYHHTQITGCIERIRNSVKRYLNITVSFGVSRISHGWESLPKCYLEAERLLKNKFYQGKDQVYWDCDQSSLESDDFSLDIGIEKQLITDLKSLEKEKVKAIIDRIFDELIAKKVSRRATQMICIGLVNTINRVAGNACINTSPLYSGAESLYLKIQQFETISEIKREIWDLCLNVMTLLERMDLYNDYSEYTKKAIRFIYQHYQQDISLDDAARFIGISSSYLSRTFKKDCGKGFVEFLNQVRVEKAKLLIENGKGRLKAIVKEVGFNNYNYFFKVFKDWTGMTPLDYEQSCNDKVNKKSEFF